MPIPTIRFIPETFNDLELGYSSGSHSPCSPLYPDKATRRLTNEALINAPEKIILPSSISLDSIQRSGANIDYIYGVAATTLQPVIPVCIARVATSRRGLKYAHLSDEIFYIRKMGSEYWYSGKVYDETLTGMEIPSPGREEWEKERKKQIAEAQHYPDDSLNEGSGSGDYRNLNLMLYVDMPFEPGVYELYYSVLGFESNRVQVEIVFDK
ncbi:MAG: hypothetical protein LC643_02220 [Bacteroidales bacterium]|nr:hypothetical protein [Bacteroidales bacterium]